MNKVFTKNLVKYQKNINVNKLFTKKIQFFLSISEMFWMWNFKSAMGISDLRDLDLSRMLRKASRSRSSPKFRTFSHHGQMERIRISKNESRRKPKIPTIPWIPRRLEWFIANLAKVAKSSMRTAQGQDHGRVPRRILEHRNFIGEKVIFKTFKFQFKYEEIQDL